MLIWYSERVKNKEKINKTMIGTFGKEMIEEQIVKDILDEENDNKGMKRMITRICRERSIIL